jgi:DNA-binding transcriptional LysR family regulator
MLTITAPLVFGQLHLRPVLDAFLDANPAVRARRLLLDRIANIVEEGIDLAVRVAHLPGSTLAATHLGEVRRVLCAAPLLRRALLDAAAQIGDSRPDAR